MEISKDEYTALVTALQEKQQRANAELMSHMVAQFTQVLREMNEPEIAAAPSPEEIKKQSEEHRKRMRDGFACAAMQGFLAGDSMAVVSESARDEGMDEQTFIVRSAYQLADAMLTERDK